METAALILFLRNNWKALVGVVLIAAFVWVGNAYLDSVYQRGYKAGAEATTKAWKEKYDTDVAALNTKITTVESLSRQFAERSAKTIAEQSDKIDELQKQIKQQRDRYDTKVYNQAGKPVCTSDQPIYLGPDFSTEWNNLNKEIIK